MKHDENQSGKRMFYWVIAILCLIYGGVSLILSVQMAYSLNSREHLFSPDNFARNFPRDLPNRIESVNSTSSFIPPNNPVDNFSNPEFRNSQVPERFRTSIIIPLITSFCGSLISILAGICLVYLLRKKESKEIRKDMLESVILPDEKLVVDELMINNGELTQSELVKKTKLTKVKIHRIVKRLESMEIVKKYPYGLTNKIKLEKRLFEE